MGDIPIPVGDNVPPTRRQGFKLGQELVHKFIFQLLTLLTLLSTGALRQINRNNRQPSKAGA